MEKTNSVIIVDGEAPESSSDEGNSWGDELHKKNQITYLSNPGLPENVF